MVGLLVLPENFVGSRGKESSVGVPLEKFQLLSSGSGYVHTLRSGVTPCGISVDIFRSLIISHFEHPVRLWQSFLMEIFLWF